MIKNIEILRPTLCAILPCALLAGCALFAVEGGYSEVCELREAEGWRVALDRQRLVRDVGSQYITLKVTHYTSLPEPGLHISISATHHPYGKATQYKVLLDPQTVVLEVDGKKLAPRHTLREDPRSENHWKCGGRLPVPADLSLSACVGPVMTFETHAPIGRNFVLYLGVLEIDGVKRKVPPIPFCYVPRSIEMHRLM